MSQNKSSAVMQQDNEPHDSLGDFPTPPWATRALCEWIAACGYDLPSMSCREPAANRGHMVKPLDEYFGEVWASDIHDYGAGFAVQDYLFGADPVGVVGWTITNPPFRLAQQFITQARNTSRHGVAMIVRTAFLEGGERYRELFKDAAPTSILQFSERVVMHKGKLSAKGSTATAYCWLVWRKNDRTGATAFNWIPPGTRKRLERASDYEGPHDPNGGAI